jgi:hypothetical protein
MVRSAVRVRNGLDVLPAAKVVFLREIVFRDEACTTAKVHGIYDVVPS